MAGGRILLKIQHGDSMFHLGRLDVLNQTGFTPRLGPLLKVRQPGLPTFRQPIAIDPLLTGSLTRRQPLPDQTQQPHGRD